MDPTALATIVMAQPAAKTLIKIFAREKKLVAKDVPEKAREAHLPPDQIRQIGELLEWLQNHGFIEKQQAPISDFDTYYVTADGLAAERTLERVRPAAGRSFLSRILE